MLIIRAKWFGQSDKAQITPRISIPGVPISCALSFREPLIKRAVTSLAYINTRQEEKRERGRENIVIGVARKELDDKNRRIPESRAASLVLRADTSAH